MLFNRKSNTLKKLQSFFAIVLCLGILIALHGEIVKAQQVEPIPFAVPEASAAPETPAFIDDTFKPILGSLNGTVNRTLVQPDGKILVAGNFQTINGASRNGIARFKADGTLDLSFNRKSGANGAVTAIGIQTDGKIVIGGNFTMFAGQPVGNIARLNADGSFDVSFNPSKGVASAVGTNSGGTINDISITPDNRIYIGGNFTSYNGTAINRIARLYPNGVLDATFAVGTGANSTVNVIKQYTGGKILIGGFITSYNGTAYKSLARVNPDGSLDTSFVIGTGPSGGINAIVVMPDDKILVGGSIATFNTVTKNGLALLNADGSNDNTFSVTGTAATINAIARQSDGKLVVGGSFTNIGGTTRQSIARLNTDGGFDATFDAGAGLNTTGTPTGNVRDLALQADGSIVLVGTFSSYNGTSRSSIARTGSNGSLDNALAPTAATAGNIYAIAKQADGKVLLGGSFSAVGVAARSNVARVNPDGSLDTSFNPGTGANDLVESLAVQADGKILIGGEFTNYNGTAIKGIARLNADGSLDSSFIVGTGVEGGVLTMALQTDGKILIGGFITTYNSVTVNNIARLNTNGSLDASLATGTGVNSTVHKIAVQADGKILVGGEFSTYNGAARTRIMRISADGSVDASFNPGTVAGSVNDYVLQADGKIVMVGGFTTVGGVTRNRIARLSADGSLDASFDPGTGIGATPNAIAATTDGKYLVGGNFTTGDNLPKNRLLRVRGNGTIDHKFLSGLGAFGSGATIRTIVPHNGKYLIGGQFDSYNTSGRTAVVMLSNATKAPVDFDGDGKSDIAIWRHTGGQTPITFWINFSSTGGHVGVEFGIFTVDAVQPGDFDGDGKADIAVWRGVPTASAPTAYYIILSSTNSVKGFQFGLQGDRPVLEDYDGDGKDDPAVFRAPETTVGQGYWYYQGSFNNPNNGFSAVQWGMRYGSQGSDQVDDLYPGDFDGDGKADFRVQRRVDTSVGTLSTPGIFYTLTAKGATSSEQFGWAGDRSIPGDYDGDGKTDIALARGFNIGGAANTWFLRYTDGRPDQYIQFGIGGLDQFAQGDYDGDGTTDITVYRRGGENNFYILRSKDQSLQVNHWGQDSQECGPACDIAVANYNNR